MLFFAHVFINGHVTIVTIIFYYYAKHRSKQKNIGTLTIQKWKKIINNYKRYYFGAVIKIEKIDFDNTLLDENSYENVLMYMPQISDRCEIIAYHLP